ncbi:Cro/CI family transcriptional regulator [Ensifer sp. ENS08]|uniref:transcriptional regulator n=1 Tax=Ensifer sp. ENS08 TaxID=2769273 RepID=UPI00177E0E41|nr:Cro/CI family transcriptional regulator [Ensifer sp. ENS08]MBD9571734.1 helix-turn-helix domain-containing protein [Ensifer sp. ENS08]
MEHSLSIESLDRARKAVGGSSALARKLNITPQAVSQWKEAPPERVLAIERETGVSRHDLRRDVFGPPVGAE